MFADRGDPVADPREMDADGADAGVFAKDRNRPAVTR
jgi:hypothetical protein